MQVVLSGFIVRLFCFDQAKTLFMYGCRYSFTALVCVCEDTMVMKVLSILTTHNKLIIVFIFSKPRPFYIFDVI